MISREELLRIQWTPKLYLHNTPHCITAYLGALDGQHLRARNHGASEGCQTGGGCHDRNAADTEVAVGHPARLPGSGMRKRSCRGSAASCCSTHGTGCARAAAQVGLHGRLIGAAQNVPDLGRAAAEPAEGHCGRPFEDVRDPDHHIGLMRKAMDAADFNRYVLGLRHGEPLDLMLRDNMGATPPSCVNWPRR